MPKIILKTGELESNMGTLDVAEMAYAQDSASVFCGTADGNILLGSSGGVGTKLYKVNGTFSEATSSISISDALAVYNVGDDYDLYIGGVLKDITDNYTFSEGVLTKVDDGTGDTWPANTTWRLNIIKNVAVTDPDEDWIDGGSF